MPGTINCDSHGLVLIFQKGRSQNNKIGLRFLKGPLIVFQGMSVGLIQTKLHFLFHL